METRFTKERRRHIAEQHPYMQPHLEKVRETVLAARRAVTPSTSDATVSRYYRKYDLEDLGTKYLCVRLSRKPEGDSFIITAYPTHKIK